MIVLDGMRRMYEDGEDAIYYITVDNENYRHPPMPAGVEEGIIRGIYKFSSKDAGEGRRTCNCSAPARSCARCCGPRRSWPSSIGVSINVWSVTSYTELARDAHAAERWNMLHPTGKPRQSYLEQALAGEGAVHQCQSTTCGRWPSRSARRCPAGCSRWAPTASAAAKTARACGATSRSTPRASPWPPCTNCRSAGRSSQDAWPRPSRNWASTARKIDPAHGLARVPS